MKYSSKEVEFIKKHYQDKGASWCAQYLPGRTATGVTQKAKKLGLSYQGPKLGCFKKGSVPVNKGQKVPDHIKQKSKNTWFKKGHQPLNTAHDGAIRIRKDNRGVPYQYIRLDVGKWELLHRYIWTQHHGPIPSDHVVRFKNGNTLQANIDNLELMPKFKNMVYNQNLAYPKSIRDQAYALEKLKSSIRSKRKDHATQ